jgi:multiple sugar transport system ATP-binding protein
VVARFPESSIHIFDGTTGEALKNRSLEEVDSVEISV